MRGRLPIAIHYESDMESARRFYEMVFDVKLTWLREPEPHVPARVASFTDSEGNGFELRQAVREV